VRESSKAAIRAQLSAFLSTRSLQGFDIILDSVAGPYFQPSYDALNPCGRHVIFGAAALTPPPGISLERNWGLLAPWNLLAAVKLLVAWLNRPKLDVLAMPGHNKGVIGFNLIWLYDQMDLITDLYDRVEQLQLQAPLVGKEFDWEQLPEALAFLQSGKSVGKVVVTISNKGS
jgi:NADPH:quinone reductase-like Zn-dependent oxidoreductase